MAQLQEATRTGEDQVAELAMGFGQGLSRRVRASDSVEQKLVEAEQALHTARAEKQYAKSQRAKARWHLAMEKVTMGALPGNFLRRSKFRSLWRWRSVATALHQEQEGGASLPLVLRRGWRLSPTMSRDWQTIRPFFWSHPLSFFLEGLPMVVQLDEVESGIAEFLYDRGPRYQVNKTEKIRQSVGDSYSLEAARKCFEVIAFSTSPSSDSWIAGLTFSSYEAAAATLKAASERGIQLRHAAPIPAVKSRIEQTRAAYSEARKVEDVNPTSQNADAKQVAKVAYKAAKLGLKIVGTAPKARRVDVDVGISLARGVYRTQEPTSAASFLARAAALIANHSNKVAAARKDILNQERKISRFRVVAGREEYGAAVTAMSAFEALQALSNREFDSTSCCICLDALGSTDVRGDGNAVKASISMTKCGVSRVHV